MVLVSIYVGVARSCRPQARSQMLGAPTSRMIDECPTVRLRFDRRKHDNQIADGMRFDNPIFIATRIKLYIR